jgi:hypothetical protein
MGGTKLDKVCIFGIYEFIGFHLGKKFLEKGFSVEGIHLDSECDLFLEEKRLEVGRNANFNEKSFPLLEQNRETEVAIIPIYDWFMIYKEGNLSYKKLFSEIIQFIKNEPKTNFVFLLPIQLLTDWQHDEGMEETRNLLDQTKKLDQCIQYFYLPTIFGPWQPGSFLFQKELFNQMYNQNKQIEVREWPFDAIFVDDLVTPIIERIESGEAGSFLIESGIPKSWELCAEILQLDTGLGKVFDDVMLKDVEGVTKITIPEVTPYQEALQAQKEHFAFIDKLMDLP